MTPDDRETAPCAARFSPDRPDGRNATLDTPISADGRPEFGTIYEITARCGCAVRLEPGERLTVVNPSGTQVCDFWAFVADDPREFISMEHLRPALGRTILRPGDALVTNRREALLVLEEDASPGIHDTLIAACDAARYRQLGAAGYHDNCTDNLRMALLAIGSRTSEIPAPLNLWMNIPVAPDGSFRWLPPVAKPGDHVTFRALRGCIVVMSACPQDMLPVNGEAAMPGPLRFRVAARDAP